MEKGTGATVRKASRERPPLDLRRMSSIPGDDDGRDGESDDCDGNGERKTFAEIVEHVISMMMVIVIKS